MKTIAITTVGWSEDDCAAFEQYVKDVSEEFAKNITITYATDHCFEIYLDEEDSDISCLIINASTLV